MGCWECDMWKGWLWMNKWQWAVDRGNNMWKYNAKTQNFQTLLSGAGGPCLEYALRSFSFCACSCKSVQFPRVTSQHVISAITKNELARGCGVSSNWLRPEMKLETSLNGKLYGDHAHRAAAARARGAGASCAWRTPAGTLRWRGASAQCSENLVLCASSAGSGDFRGQPHVSLSLLSGMHRFTKARAQCEFVQFIYGIYMLIYILFWIRALMERVRNCVNSVTKNIFMHVNLSCATFV